LESVVISSESADISKCIVAWSEPVDALSSTAQFITESWMVCDVKVRSIIEVPLPFRYHLTTDACLIELVLAYKAVIEKQFVQSI
jgi:hypothetical protein